MFLHLSAILFTGGDVSQHAKGIEYTPLRRHPPEMATEAGGMHPIGMHFVFKVTSKLF